MRKQKMFYGEKRLIWMSPGEGEAPKTNESLTPEELEAEAEFGAGVAPEKIAAARLVEAEANLRNAQTALNDTSQNQQDKKTKSGWSKAMTEFQKADEEFIKIAGGTVEVKQTVPEPSVPAAPPAPEAAPQAPAAPAAPAAAPEAAPEKTDAQRDCETMKKYVGEGGDKKISFANFEALLKKHGELGTVTNLTTLDNLNEDNAEKIVSAVNKVQETAREKLPANNPLKDSPLVKDGIFGNKTFQACIDAKLIKENGTLEVEAPPPAEAPEAAPAPAPETPPAPAPEANAPAPAPEANAPAPAPEASKEQIPVFDYSNNYEKFYAIKSEIGDDATRQQFQGRRGEVVYIKNPQTDIQGDSAKVELNDGTIAHMPIGILSCLKGVNVSSDVSKITAYMAKRYEKTAEKLGIKKDNIKILDGRAVLTTSHANNPAVVDAQPSIGKKQENVALARFSDTSATDAQKDQYIIERCGAEATLGNTTA